MRIIINGKVYDENAIFIRYEKGNIKLSQGDDTVIVTSDCVDKMRESVMGNKNIDFDEYEIIVDQYEVVIRGIYGDIVIFNVDEFISGWDAVFDDELESSLC